MRLLNKFLILSTIVLQSMTCLFCKEPQDLKILVKIPTRERPEKFFEVLDQYYALLSGKQAYEFVISCDLDDAKMNNTAVIEKLKTYKNLSYYFDNRSNKIAAFNRDIEKHEFDILVCASDDMLPILSNYDEFISKTLLDHHPDLDGIINSSDGFIGEELNTIPIIGRKFYDRFQYVFNPVYKTLFCDLELTLISKLLKKEVVVNECIFKHLHPCYGYSNDDLYAYNSNTFLEKNDKEIFHSRLSRSFEISEMYPDALLSSLHIFGKIKNNVTWSILIPTLEERTSLFSPLYLKLLNLIIRANLNTDIEILTFKDDRKYKVGFKRNALLSQAQGKYISFIDDDDDVSDQYIRCIYSALKKDPDCVSLKGVITTNGLDPKMFIHSIKYTSYFEDNRIYYRPPNHLNPIKKSIASQFLFPEKNLGEDTEWAMAIAKSGYLKKEMPIKKVCYFYKFQDKN